MQCAFYNIAHQSGPRIFYVPHSTALRSVYSTSLSLILINILFFKPWILTTNDMMFNGRLSWTQYTYNYCSRSQRPCGVRRRSPAARLRLWVRISPGAYMSVCCECCMLLGRGLCDELITRPEESYRLWCVVGCDLETSWIRRLWPMVGGPSRQKQTNNYCKCILVYTTLKMATRLAETCLWLLCNRITFIRRIAFVGICKPIIQASVDSSFLIILSFSHTNKRSWWTVRQKQ